LAEVFEIDAEVDSTDRGPRVTPLGAIHDTEDDPADDSDDTTATTTADDPTV
jgi:iron complex transport system ATP-binding protein